MPLPVGFLLGVGEYGGSFFCITKCGGVDMSKVENIGFLLVVLLGILWSGSNVLAGEKLKYPVVDTGQDQCFEESDSVPCPEPGEDWFGQDAQYQGNLPAYRDNGDGTITDLITGLMWQKTPDFRRYTFTQAPNHAFALTLGGHTDWRLPTIRELFSIADFNGNMHSETPYLDTRFFDFQYPMDGQRDMDAQFWSSTASVGLVMERQKAAFGFNFADGRIKGYPVSKGNWIRCVRGPAYGTNDFTDNNDGTVTDRGSGLMWTKADNGRPVSWRQALALAGKSVVGGHSDWRLPDIKELQTLADYTRSPAARSMSARAPAINSVFQLTVREPWLWSSTTHIETGGAYYLCVGQGTGYGPRGGSRLMDVHGAGAVRSDPKSGSASRYAGGHGPQKDEVRIRNYVLLVRGGKAERVNVPYRPVQVGPQGRSARQQGAVGREHTPGRQEQKRGARGFMQRFDRDGDNRVARSEFDGPASHFNHMDRNRDGFIDRSEAPSGPPPKGGPPRRQ